MVSSDRAHRCPVGDCTARVSREQLICPRHWQLVPPKLTGAASRVARWPRSRHSRAPRRRPGVYRRRPLGLSAGLRSEPPAHGPSFPGRLSAPKRHQRRELGRGRRVPARPRDALPPAQTRSQNAPLPALRRDPRTRAIEPFWPILPRGHAIARSSPSAMHAPSRPLRPCRFRPAPQRRPATSQAAASRLRPMTACSITCTGYRPGLEAP